jgi:hypothetical protein
MFETGNTERPPRSCANCGAEVAPGDTFCVHCGMRQVSGPEGFETQGKSSTSDELKGLGKDFIQRSKEVYEKGSARYWEWSEAKAAEREREEVRRKLGEARATFERIYLSCGQFLDWLDEYRVAETEGRQQPSPDQLISVRNRAQRELEKITEYENSLSNLTQDHSLREQTSHVLEDLGEGLLDVGNLLEEFGLQLQSVEGWQKYKEEFGRFLQELHPHVGRASGSGEPPNPPRFANPHQTRAYEYKMVQIRPTVAVQASEHIGDEAARYLQSVVNERAVNGWEFYRVDTLSVAIPPGCLAGIFGAPTAYNQYYVVTFRRALGG